MRERSAVYQQAWMEHKETRLANRGRGGITACWWVNNTKVLGGECAFLHIAMLISMGEVVVGKLWGRSGNPTSVQQQTLRRRLCLDKVVSAPDHSNNGWVKC